MGHCTLTFSIFNNCQFTDIFQGVLSFVYITLLSSVGERLAANLRIRLFDSVLQQDIEFFDSHRSGDIINRLVVSFFPLMAKFPLVLCYGRRIYVI